MAPNLLIIGKKAITPWTWCISNKSKAKETRKLYFSQQPTPGIYAITSTENRYLVALRPNGKKDTEHIFTAKGDVRRKPMDSAIETNTPRQLDSSGNSLHNIQFDFTQKNSFSSEVTFDIHINSTTNSSASSILDPTHLLTPNFYDNTRSRTPSPLRQGSRNASPSPQSSRRSSIIPSNRAIYSPEYILKKDGALPHQNSPFAKSRNDSHHSLSSFRLNKHKDNVQRLEEVDINGYRFLQHPLRIEFNQTIQRWMFSSEVRTRTIVTPICKDLNCMDQDLSSCGKTIDMELFCLDDGESWVIVPKRWRSLKRDTEFRNLYCVDDKTECVRRQTVEESNASHLRLVQEKGRFLVSDENVSYMLVVRYLEGKRH